MRVAHHGRQIIRGPHAEQQDQRPSVDPGAGKAVHLLQHLPQGLLGRLEHVHAVVRGDVSGEINWHPVNADLEPVLVGQLGHTQGRLAVVVLRGGVLAQEPVQAGQLGQKNMILEHVGVQGVVGADQGIERRGGFLAVRARRHVEIPAPLNLITVVVAPVLRLAGNIPRLQAGEVIGEDLARRFVGRMGSMRHGHIFGRRSKSLENYFRRRGFSVSGRLPAV
jgi:hypothetical protein